MKHSKLYWCFLLLLSVSCNNHKTENQISPAYNDDNKPEVFKSKVIIILSEKLNKDSNIINIQDYVDGEVTYIPFFSSKKKFTASTKGADLGKQIIEIEGMFLLSMLSGNETLRMNPGLGDEKNYKASDLISKYKQEIETLKIEMEHSKN